MEKVVDIGSPNDKKVKKLRRRDQEENERKLRLYLWRMQADARKDSVNDKTDYNGRTPH